MSENSRSPVSSVAVIGAGLMGHGIAQVMMLAGLRVRVWDPDLPTLLKVPTRIIEHLLLMGVDQPVTVELAPSLEDAVTGAEVIFEAIPENLALKHDVIRKLDKSAPSAVVASNTSVLRISEIAEASALPERIVGAHWWNPPYLIRVVEVVPGQRTSPQTLTTISNLLAATGKTPVLINRDAPGFVGNRMQFALWREAMMIVEEGICSAADVDLVARETFGRRLASIGPLENADYIGLDLTTAIMDYLLPSLSASARTPELVRRAVDQGHLGAKSGSGLFDWPANSRERTERRLLEHLLAASNRPSSSER